RGQNVEVEIRVPIGKMIRFDESVIEKLNSVNVSVKRVSHRKSGVDIEFYDDHSFPYRSGVDYKMGVNGQLISADGVEINQDKNDYRYSEDSDSIKLEKLKKEVKELEEKKKSKKPNASIEVKQIMKSHEKEISGPN